MRRVVTLAALALVAGCQDPPGTGNVTDATVVDARVTVDGGADAAAADAGMDAGAVDAAPVDATPMRPDAIPPDADPLDPYDIALTDVSFSAVGTWVYGGRTNGDLWGVGSGAAIGDVDGDGDLDILVARIDDPDSTRPGGPTTLLRNVGPGPGFASFLVDPALALTFANVRAHGAALADFDRDGDLDAFVACEGRDYLLENDGGGSFADVTLAAGVGGPTDDITMGAFFADVNHDGLMDLYVGAHAAVSPPFPEQSAADRLYLNLGDGTFEDVSDAAGVGSQGSTQAAAAFDLEKSGDLVIYVANDRFAVDGTSVFGDPDLLPADDWFQLTGIDDQGVPSFTQRAVERGVDAQRSSMGVAIADVDGDLSPDVYVTDWGHSDLYLNLTPGSGPLDYETFYDIGMRHDPFGELMIHWGARFMDLDRDGLLEVFLVNGSVGEPFSCSAFSQLDDLLRQPAPGVPYDFITAQAGLPWPPVCFAADRPVVGRGGVVGDLDGDGDDDIVVTPYVEPYRIYRNDTAAAGHHYVRVRLHGGISGVDPIGATLVVTRLDGTQVARYRYAGGDTYSQSDTPLEVGLRTDTTVMSAVVHWPSGLQQRIDGLPGFATDTEVIVVEPNWLSVEPRVVTAADPAPIFTYVAVDEAGLPLGATGAGRLVTVTRSDGVAVAVTDEGDGTYSAPLPHPGLIRRTVLTVVVDGDQQRPRPMIGYR